ncbi:hypothetical protein CBR_g19902 [Chara braunii]|uniref:Uncharacterized protein n=1 Tax=Chara braunii TaxID=69332 RepID=A0A388KYZ0_CHABU|nr:hypothetical protein CBR_g19902 [Chara braunii]|eukprot:GBG75269.1 hypothetical protein CBR_g19902 [Chara braunii]
MGSVGQAAVCLCDFQREGQAKKRPIIPSFTSPFRAASGLLSTSLNGLIKRVKVPHFNVREIGGLKYEIGRINEYGMKKGLDFEVRTYDIKEMFMQLPHEEISKAVKWVVDVCHEMGLRWIWVNNWKKQAMFGKSHGEDGWKSARLSRNSTTIGTLLVWVRGVGKAVLVSVKAELDSALGGIDGDCIRMMMSFGLSYGIHVEGEAGLAEGDRSSNSGKGSAANAFPGPGNRAYFTKEYMDILEDIKSTKVLDEAKKKIAGTNRRGGGLQISGNSGESRVPHGQSEDRSDEMKAWVSSTLGDSLKLITRKLQEVDAKANVAAAEKEELLKLRAEKAALELVVLNRGKKTSSEKRKRVMTALTAPVVATLKTNATKVRSRGSSKSRSRRVEVSSDEDGEDDDGVKQNLAPKMEKSSDLSEVKTLVTELVQGLAAQKGKQRANTPEQAPVPEHECEETEDLDLAQKPLQGEEEEVDEDDLVAYMKMRHDFYMSFHFSRVQELCKQRGVHYV